MSDNPFLNYEIHCSLYSLIGEQLNEFPPPYKYRRNPESNPLLVRSVSAYEFDSTATGLLDPTPAYIGLVFAILVPVIGCVYFGVFLVSWVFYSYSQVCYELGGAGSVLPRVEAGQHCPHIDVCERGDGVCAWNPVLHDPAQDHCSLMPHSSSVVSKPLICCYWLI